MFSLIFVGSVRLDQIFRGAPHSPVSLLNKCSIRSTGLTANVSENLSYTAFTIDKDNSLTPVPVPKPPAPVHGHCEQPKFHKVEFTPRSTPVPGRMAGSQRSEEESAAEQRPRPAEPDVTDGPAFPARARQDDRPRRDGGYAVFVPEARETYEERVPDATAYTDPDRAVSRCSLKSPSGFAATKPAAEPRVVQERSLPVRTLIDTFEHNDRPVMRYLQLEERVPLSPEIRRLHDDPPPEPSAQHGGGYYTCDTAVETRSFAAAEDSGRGGEPEDYDKINCRPFADDDGSVFADDDGSVLADDDKSGYANRSEDACSFRLDAGRSDARFQTVRQLATPDSLESSMLFAQKQTERDAPRRQEHHNGRGAAPRRVRGKTDEHVCTFAEPTVAKSGRRHPFVFHACRRRCSDRFAFFSSLLLASFSFAFCVMRCYATLWYECGFFFF